MIPTPLIISLAGQKEGIPFPTFIEAMLMEITFALLREASARMPRAISSAISIVGALVLGQSAVQAGLVSSAMVIVISITAISGFILPSFEFGISVILLRVLLMVLSTILGLFGILLGCIALMLLMCHMTSFGIPYMSPLSPLKFSNLKDAYFRVPWPMQKKHSKLKAQKGSEQQGTSDEGEIG